MVRWSNGVIKNIFDFIWGNGESTYGKMVQSIDISLYDDILKHRMTSIQGCEQW